MDTTLHSDKQVLQLHHFLTIITDMPTWKTFLPLYHIVNETYLAEICPSLGNSGIETGRSKSATIQPRQGPWHSN